jgi:hypothetical protein
MKVNVLGFQCSLGSGSGPNKIPNPDLTIKIRIRNTDCIIVHNYLRLPVHSLLILFSLLCHQVSSVCSLVVLPLLPSLLNPPLSIVLYKSVQHVGFAYEPPYGLQPYGDGYTSVHFILDHFIFMFFFPTCVKHVMRRIPIMVLTLPYVLKFRPS